VRMGNRKLAAVFGAADGLALILGLVLGLAVSRQPGGAVWHAALAGGVAEFGGMALGQYWSDPGKDKIAALCNGAAGMAAVICPGVPFAVMAGGIAVGVSAVAVACFGLAITWMRSESGWLAFARTFGLLLAAGALSAASGLLLNPLPDY
jgi:VIT family protein